MRISQLIYFSKKMNLGESIHQKWCIFVCMRQHAYEGGSSPYVRKADPAKNFRVGLDDLYDGPRPRSRINLNRKPFIMNGDDQTNDLIEPVGFDPSGAPIYVDFEGGFEFDQAAPRRAFAHDCDWVMTNAGLLKRYRSDIPTGQAMLKECKQKLPVVPSSRFAQRFQSYIRGSLSRYCVTNVNEAFFVTVLLGVVRKRDLDDRDFYREAAASMLEKLTAFSQTHGANLLHLNGYFEIAEHSISSDKKNENRNVFIKDWADSKGEKFDADETVYVFHSHLLAVGFDEQGVWPHEFWKRKLKPFFPLKKQLDIRALGLRSLNDIDISRHAQNCIEYAVKDPSLEKYGEEAQAANFFVRDALPNLGMFEGVLHNQLSRSCAGARRYFNRRTAFFDDFLPFGYRGLDDDLLRLPRTYRLARANSSRHYPSCSEQDPAKSGMNVYYGFRARAGGDLDQHNSYSEHFFIRLSIIVSIWYVICWIMLMQMPP